MCNCVGSTVIGSSVGFFLGVSLGGVKGWEQFICVGLEPGGLSVASMGNYNDVIGRV